MPPNFSAGSASVNIVPDFSGAQRKIGEWFATMKDAKIHVDTDVDNNSIRRTTAAIASIKPSLNVDVDHKYLAKSATEAVKSLTGLADLGAMVSKVISPLALSGIAGGLISIAGAASQAGGAIALLPAGLTALAVPLAVTVIGLQGMGDAFKALASGDIEKTNEALKNLAPSARNFVTEVHSLAPAFKDLRLDIQQELFEGLGKRVKDLGTAWLPILHEGLVPIAGDLRELASNIIYTLGTTSNLNAFSETLGNVHLAFAAIAEAFAPLTQMMIDFTTVGSRFLPGIAGAFRDAADAAAEWVSHARETGQLQEIIQVAIDRIKQLAGLLLQVAGTLVAIFKPAIASGVDLIDLLTKIFQGFNHVLSLDTGQSALKTFFEGIATALNALYPAIVSLFEVFVTKLLPAFGQLAANLAPVVNGLLVAFSSLLNALVPVLPILSDAIVVLYSAMTPLIPVFTEIITAILPVLAKLMSEIGPIISEVAEEIGTFLGEAVRMLEPLLVQLADAFIQCLDAILPIIPPILSLVKELLPPLITVLEAVIPVIVQLVETVAPFVAQLVEALMPAIKLVADIIAWAFKEIIGPVLTFVINTIVKPLLDLFIAEINLLTDVVKFTWENIIKPVWQAIADTAKWLWENILRPAWDGMKVAWDALMLGFKTAWEIWLKPTWDALAAAANWLWNNVLKPVFDFIGAAWDALMKAMRALYDNVLHPMWTIFTIAIQAVKNSFDTVVQGIRTAWEALKAIVATPINFVIEFVFNRGLFAAWNWLVDTLHLPFGKAHFNQITGPGIPTFAYGGEVDATRGGRVPGGYTGARSDSVLAKLTPQEFVIQQPVAVRTRSFLEALNAGQAEAVQAAGGWDAMGPRNGYAAGGNVQGALDFVRAQQGKPYIWGGVGPAGFDCSGLQSAITNILRGAAPNRRVGTTATFPWPGFASGFGSPYTIGATKNAFNSGVGHMAGTLDGHRAESGSGHGPMLDGIALGANAPLFGIHGWLNALAGATASSSAAIDHPWYVDLWHDLKGAKDWLMNHVLGPVANVITKFTDFPLTKAITHMPLTMVEWVWDAVKDTIAALFLQGQTRDPGDQVGIKSDISAIAQNYGWQQGSSQWNGIDFIVSKESGWNPLAQNPTSSASGLFQQIDSTWRAYRPIGVTAGHMKDARVVEQGQAGLHYISDVYKTPNSAQAYWQAHHWYDNGGWLPPGISTIFNGTGRPEPVLTANEHDALLSWNRGHHHGHDRDGWGNALGHVHFHGVDERTRNSVMDDLWHRLRVASRGGVHSTAAVYSVG